MEDKNEEVGKMETQLKRWGAKIDELAAAITTAGSQAKADEQQLVMELRAKQVLLQARLKELKAEGVDKWETFKDGIESAYLELESAFKKLAK